MKKYFIPILIILCLTLCACSRNEQTLGEPVSNTEVRPEPKPFIVGSTLDSSGCLAFTATAQEFADAFNAVYRERNGAGFLTPVSEWEKEQYGSTRHFGEGVTESVFYEENVSWTVCSLTAYTSPGDELLRELTIDFDEHGYSEDGFEEYTELCVCALQTFFPSMPQEQAEALFSELFIESDEEITELDFLDSTGAKRLRYSGAAGVYPYLAYGERTHICFVPVGEELKSRGVRIEVPDNPAALADGEE